MTARPWGFVHPGYVRDAAGWTARFVAYARAMGRTPQAQFDEDRRAMGLAACNIRTPFHAWAQAQFVAWQAEAGEPPGPGAAAAFDAWCARAAITSSPAPAGATTTGATE